jgi:uncharacterized protein YqfB (UPF0267 family)
MKIRKKHWLEYQLELVGTKAERDLTEGYLKSFEKDKEERVGFFEERFGLDSIAISKNNTVMLTGVIEAHTPQGCKGTLSDLKYVAKKMYSAYCKKVVVWLAAEGEEM